MLLGRDALTMRCTWEEAAPMRRCIWEEMHLRGDAPGKRST